MMPSFNGVTAQGSVATISFNGTNPNHNNWLIDGGEVYDRGSGGKLDVLPAPDVIAEFQVLASNYPPDYGINSGGTVLMQLNKAYAVRLIAGAIISLIFEAPTNYIRRLSKMKKGTEPPDSDGVPENAWSYFLAARRFILHCDADRAPC